MDGMVANSHGERAAPIDLSGLWVPIVTPFNDAGAVDVTSLRRLGNRLLSDGATGLVALGTTGEPATLSLEERLTVVEVCNDVCREAKRQLMVGVGTNDTAATIAETLTVTARTSPAAVLVVVPYYTRPSEEAVVEHLRMVADASPVPVVMYNIPYRTGQGLGREAVLAASAHPNIAGIKQSVAGIDTDTLEILARAGNNFQVLAGDDAFITPTILMGGRGAIAAAAHLCTPLFVEMTAAAIAGDVDRARRLAELLLPLVRAGFAEPSPAVWKGALHQSGQIATPNLRRPMTSASAGAVAQLRQAETAATASHA